MLRMLRPPVTERSRICRKAIDYIVRWLGPQVGRRRLNMLCPDSRPTLVLDTNVVLDWLYFCDPRAARLAATIASGAAKWIGSATIGAELQHVLARDPGRRGPVAINATRTGWSRWIELAEPIAREVPPALRCSDPGDQKFIDLAWHYRASLLSADHAVLRLRRHAAGLGLTILRLEDWQPPHGPYR